MDRAFIDGVGVGTVYTRGSQWRGYPVMPADYPLPMVPNKHRRVPYVSPWDGRSVEDPEFLPLPFLCQIDCRELPAEVTALPHDGELYIFAELKYYLGWQSEPLPMYAGEDRLRVIYIPENELTDLEVRRHKDFVPVETPQRITLNFDRPQGEEGENQLLGRPEHRQWEDWDEPYSGWRLLFQMDSDDHYNFMDCGVFNILISEEDLKNRDFSHVVGIILSS